MGKQHIIGLLENSWYQETVCMIVDFTRQTIKFIIDGVPLPIIKMRTAIGAIMVQLKLYSSLNDWPIDFTIIADYTLIHYDGHQHYASSNALLPSTIASRQSFNRYRVHYSWYSRYQLLIWPLRLVRITLLGCHAANASARLTASEHHDHYASVIEQNTMKSI